MIHAERWSATDCLVACESLDGTFVISSPNCDQLLQPWLHQREVHWGANGMFNGHDPVRWPQCFTSRDTYRWAMAVRRCPSEDTPEFAMWRPLDVTSNDVVYTDSSRRFCVLADPIRASMKPMVEMLLARHRAFAAAYGAATLLSKICKHVEYVFGLLPHPRTPRDQVRMVGDLQRNWAFGDAWLEWYAYLYPPSQGQFKDPDTTR